MFPFMFPKPDFVTIHKNILLDILVKSKSLNSGTTPCI